MKLHRLPDPSYKLLTQCDLNDGVFISSDNDEKLWFIKNNTSFNPFPLSEPLGDELISALTLDDKFFYLTSKNIDQISIEFPSGVCRNVGNAKSATFKPINDDRIALWSWTDCTTRTSAFDVETCRETSKRVIPNNSDDFQSYIAYNYNLVGTSDRRYLHLYDIRTCKDGGKIEYCNFSRSPNNIWLHRRMDDNINVISTGMRGNMETIADIRKGKCFTPRALHHTDWQYTFDVIQWGKMSSLFGFISASMTTGTVRLTLYDSNTKNVFETVTLCDKENSSTVRDELIPHYDSNYSRCAPLCQCVHHIVIEH